MTAPLTQFEALLYGNVRYQRAGWLIPLFMRVAMLRRDDVVAYTGISDHTAQRYLEDLAYLGIIIRQGYRDGYVLTAGGKQLVAAPLLLTAGESIVVVAEPGEGATSEGANCTFDSIRESESCIVESSDLRIEEEINHPQSEQGANCTFEKMIEESGRLFGDAISATGLQPRSIDYTLGWLAQAYAQAGNGALRSPQALVYRRLKDGNQQPVRKYRDHPTDYLPREYLQAIGLADPEPEPEPDQAPVACDDRMQPDGSATDDVQQQYAQALADWDTRLGDGPSEERAFLTNWLLGTYPVRRDSETVYIGVANSYAAAYLQEHADRVRQALALPWFLAFAVAAKQEAPDEA